ncbi:DUF6525 family protein [Kozakia baliensis]|uniref:DUF6525 family protein n=1 Tax=Kozakia baliensis TaxID=153496 RepID=UPI000496F824|nr:DUF6525 family protein [Kozakia baliensis]
MSHCPTDNDGTPRKEIWRRYAGDEWEAFDQLPLSIRRRLMEHAYDAWSVNAFMLWRHYKRVHGKTPRAEAALKRYLDYCERLELQAFAEKHEEIPHVSASATTLRYSRKAENKKSAA